MSLFINYSGWSSSEKFSKFFGLCEIIFVIQLKKSLFSWSLYKSIWVTVKGDCVIVGLGHGAEGWPSHPLFPLISFFASVTLYYLPTCLPACVLSFSVLQIFKCERDCLIMYSYTLLFHSHHSSELISCFVLIFFVTKPARTAGVYFKCLLSLHSESFYAYFCFFFVPVCSLLIFYTV